MAQFPGITLPTYAASKEALHSYTTSLRLSLEGTPVKVVELMPPLVDTEFSKEIGGHNEIKPSVVADKFLAALEKDELPGEVLRLLCGNKDRNWHLCREN